MLGVIRSFYDGMYAGIQVFADAPSRIEVKSGLSQWCTMAPRSLPSILTLWWADDRPF